MTDVQDDDQIIPMHICSQCQKAATFMCSSCSHDGPRYCSVECQKAHWTEGHYRNCTAAKRTRQLHRQAVEASLRIESTSQEPDIQLNDLSNREQDEKIEQEEAADELKFYTEQIYRIIKPVVICIILSIFWVKVSFGGKSDYTPSRPTYVSTASTTSSASSDSGIAQSFTNAAIIIGQIIGVTILIVFFFKKGWIKVLIGFFMVVVLLLLGFMTYLLLLNLVQVFLIPLDYITMSFALWNFAMVGLVSIFWKGPLWLQQCYLTIMSSLMAFSLTGLEQWTTWILLGLLAIWDLVAVLCPFGPLRLLIESSRTQQKEVPALLYSVNAVWFMMASTDHLRLSSSMLGDEPSRPNDKVVFRQSGSSFIQNNFRRSHDGFMRLPDDSHVTVNTSSTADRHPPDVTPAESNDTSIKVEADEEDVERSGLKLGLGDFVFYSVLIARAALYDWITTVCCTIAVLTGLTTTIFLLAIYKKALPALPISIAFGMLYYFVAKTVLVPYVAALCVFGMVGL
ncbi:Presenilin-domain-containing protein [Thamnidium elegans]|nr:Presenilin-domain-containing protein [Thamnidium elegans]